MFLVGSVASEGLVWGCLAVVTGLASVLDTGRGGVAVLTLLAGVVSDIASVFLVLWVGLAVLVAGGIAAEAFSLLVWGAGSLDLVDTFPSDIAFEGIEQIIAVPWVISDIGTSLALGSVLVLGGEMAPTAVGSATLSLAVGDVEAFSAGRVLTAFVYR